MTSSVYDEQMRLSLQRTQAVPVGHEYCHTIGPAGEPEARIYAIGRLSRDSTDGGHTCPNKSTGHCRF